MKFVLNQMRTLRLSRVRVGLIITIACLFPLGNCTEQKEPTITEIRDLLDTAHLSEAIKKASTEAEKSGKTDQIHYLKGWIHYLRHEDEAAAREYRICLKENPGSIDCIRGLARIDYLKADFGEAEKGLTKALSLAESRKELSSIAAIQTDLGNLSIARNNRKEAIERYNKAIQAEKEGSAYFGLGLAYLLERDKVSAAKYLRQGLAVEYKDSIIRAETYYLLAKLQFESEKDPKSAAESARKAFELFPAREEYAKAWEHYSRESGSK